MIERQSIVDIHGFVMHQSMATAQLFSANQVMKKTSW